MNRGFRLDPTIPTIEAAKDDGDGGGCAMCIAT